MRRLGGVAGAFASQVVRVGLLSFIAALSLAWPAWADGEHAVFPFQCSIERGRILVTPAAERAYRVVGPRASHAFTACAPANPQRCRTWQIHKFDLLCGAQRVPWVAVAAALIERTPQRGRFENGRLQLRLGPEWQRRALIPAGFRDPFGDADKTLAFPVGFAPGLGSGLRFVGGLSPPPTVVDAKPDPKASEARAAEAKLSDVRSAEGEVRTGRVEPRGERATAISQGWTATVTPAGAPELVDAGVSVFLRALVGGVAVLMAWGGLLFVRRHSAIKATGVAPGHTAQDATPSTTTATDEAALCAELVARAVNLHSASRDALVQLPNLNLRDILSNDLAVIQARLLSAELTADVADERWHAVKPVVATALTDLERIARIITGVLSSQPTPLPAASPLLATAVVPETTDEAFEVLGVNPQASRTVVKKVVDGLRQSWHPDHARDAEDRSRREERMKQINTAWDLIRTHSEVRTIDAEAERAA